MYCLNNENNRLLVSRFQLLDAKIVNHALKALRVIKKKNLVNIFARRLFGSKIKSMDILIPYLHYIGIMTLMGSLIAEHLFLKPGLSASRIRSLAGVDLVYGLAAIVVLATGLLRWFVYGKGSDFYLSNPLFHAKLTLFVLLGVLSIFPTIKFLKWRKQITNGKAPDTSDRNIRKMLMFVRIELLIVVIIPLLAVMIARGVGM